MSSGSFVRSRYETNQGSVAPIRIQPETLGLTLATVANTAPTEALTPGFPSAKVSGSRRQIGLSARRVRIEVTAAGTSGLSVGSIIALPWLRQATYEAIPDGATGTYNGATVLFLGRQAEARR